jgi:CheY-like chemotaxis protein
MLHESNFDLVLVDLDLPGMDGFALARLWHAQGLHAPLVAITARADAQAEPEARAAGMRDFVRKPVGGEALAEVVVRNARVRVPAAAAEAPEAAHDPA